MFQKYYRENQNEHFMFNYFFSENRAVYGIKVEKYCRSGHATDDSIMRRLRFACWINKATDAHSEYVKLIAFLRQKWLRKSPSTLRHSILHLSLSAYFSFLTFHAILRHHVPLSCLFYVRSSSHALTNEPVSYSNLGPPVSIIPCCLVRYANELAVLFRWVVSWAVLPRDSVNLKTWRQYNIIN